MSYFLQNSGLYEYKLYAIVPSATPEQISAVFLDNEYRLKWDDYVTGNDDADLVIN